VEPETGGDPAGHAKYTRSSLRPLAKRLGRASSKPVGRLLKGRDYSLRTNVKRLVGKPPPHRDRQYRFMQRVKALCRRHGDPVIRVDAEQPEVVRNFKNAGECWGVVPEEVTMYDLPSDADTVCHDPSGASKWNPIEHRVFSQLSSNWAGYPRRSVQRILGFIRGTSTETGLSIDAEVDPRTYEKGTKISDQEMRTLNLTRRRFCSHLHYTIRPRQSGNS
jgi:hypothetical protein